MTFLDFFAGIGTIRIGFEQAGWTCNGHVEWDKFAQASYNAMHDIKDGEYCGWDIRTVRADELPRSDLWTFGAPCQDFSIAGNRKGMAGERSSLVNEIFRLVEESPEENRPTWLLYENVKGMLSSNGGWDFLGILLEMDRLGYDVEWQLLNSKHFGVPQNRERVFTLGHLRGRGGRKIFPITGQSGQTGSEINVIGTINPKRHSDMDVLSPDGVSRTLTARDYKGPVMVGMLELPGKDQLNRVYSPDGLSPTLVSMQGGRQEPKIVVYGGMQKNQAVKTDGIVPCLTSSMGMGGGYVPMIAGSEEIRIRKLTPKECWRLQGIPDYYFDKAKAVNSDTQLYKQAGNACTVNVIYEIAKSMSLN